MAYEIGGNPTHGLVSTYTHYGCRCELCTRGHTEYQREMRARRHERFRRGEVTIAQHGLSTYNNWGCRCDVCMAAMWEHNQKRGKSWAEMQVPDSGTVYSANITGVRHEASLS